MRILGICAAVCGLILAAGCGGSSSGSGNSVTSVTVSCSPSPVLSAGTSQCSASVAGNGTFSSTVTWSVAGGGSIATNGAYTAPTVTANTPVVVTATSTQDTTKAGSVALTVTTSLTSSITSVTLACTPTSIGADQTSQCTPTITGTGNYNSNVTWLTSGNGSVSASGVFTPSPVSANTNVTITATSVQDTSHYAQALVTVTPAGTVTGVTGTTCNPSTVQAGQTTTCTATVTGTGPFSSAIQWTASGGSIGLTTGLFSASRTGTYTITATSQQDTTKSQSTQVDVTAGVSNVLPIVVDAGPNGNYVNGAFVSVTVCAPGTTTCQTIDHVLVDTASIGLRLLAKAAGGELDPAVVTLPLQTDGSGNPIAQCNQFIDGFTWGSVSLATIQMSGEIASTVPNAATPGVPIQIIGDPAVPTVPASCSSTGVDESTLSALGAYGVLGLGTFQQDCGSGCVGSTPPNVYYACAGGVCNVTSMGLPQQVTNPVWVLPQDNNGTLVKLPSIPSGGTTPVSGSLVIGIGTKTNNGLGTAAVFQVDSNANFTTTFNAQANNCSFIDSGSNAFFFPATNYPGLAACTSNNSSFYCPASLLLLTAYNQSNAQSGQVSFNVGNADTLLGTSGFVAFAELGGPNSTPPGCSGAFDWGLSFFYGRSVFTAIEQQPVTGPNNTQYVGPFWAY